MDQECITGLYRSVGRAVGAEFSSEDVSLFYRKVFHAPSSADEADVAMKKIAGGDISWSCVGENVLDVLIEMEREREQKEKLYWELQLLNVFNLNTLTLKDTPVFIDPHVLTDQHQNKNPNDSNKAHNSDDGSSFSCTFDTGSSQRRRRVGRIERHWSVRGVKRLKKAARQSWARLAAEGVQSLAASTWQGSPGVRGQAWGCVSLSDLLLLVEVKYDVVTNLLYKEMLQEHHTPNLWETLLPWQRHKDEEALEDQAEVALESGDMLLLSDLPGAFRIYRVGLGSRRKCWSAISLLYKLHTCRQYEMDTITALGQRLDTESLRLLCLYIRLVTLRAQRERTSYSALLAARQSWETWPHVNSPCRAEQAVLWLQDEEEEQMRDFISVSPEQAVLQLLVLTQEQERKHLVQLVHEVSLEDLRWKGCTVFFPEDQQASLKNGCIKKLEQIHVTLHTQSRTQTASQQTYPQLLPQFQPHIRSTQAVWSQDQLNNCALVLLTHLMELQEVQTSASLSALKGAWCPQALRDEYASKLQAQQHTSLLQLLIADSPSPSGSVLSPNPNLTQNNSTEQFSAQSCCSGPAENQNIGAGPPEAPTVVSIRREGRDLDAEDVTNKQDVCTGCGVKMEDLPYLEILCASDAVSNTYEGFAAEGADNGGEGSATKSPQDYEKQGSLIASAWCKPPEDDYDFGGVAAGNGTEHESTMNTLIQPCDLRSTAEHSHCEVKGSTGLPETPSEDQACRPEELTLDEKPIADQSEAEYDLQTDHPDVKQHGLCCGTSNEADDIGRDNVEEEICHTASESELLDLRALEPPPLEDQKYTSQPTVDCCVRENKSKRESLLVEKERAGEPVSAMEREKTMRNLVDMQRKVEQRQQRDRDRQLLRVQERLSIIQNRKAEEDLLGLKHTDRLRHLTRDLPQEDKNQQKTVVRERLEQLRRERSYAMQSKRDRNTTGFKELLAPVAIQSRETEDGAD